MSIVDQIKHAWNAIVSGRQPVGQDYGYVSSVPRHSSSVNSRFNSQTYVASIYNRIAIDVSMTNFRHVKVLPENEDESIMDSGLNECLSVEANMDQTPNQFLQDLVYSLFDEGVVAIVPVDTTINPNISGGYDINTLRVARIRQWFPKHVELELYNESTGQNENIVLSKDIVAIIENPLYAVVNQENSTLKRLVAKLNEVDRIDARSSAGRLDLLITVPYGVKTALQREQAKDRISSIEAQLINGRHGIAYIDATEKITQLNRPANDQLLESAESLTQEFYNQLGLTESIFNGTANEHQLRTYYNRTIDPISEAIVQEMTRKFLTKTGRSQGQKIVHHRDLFEMVQVEQIVNLGDAMRRNGIMTSNEIRKVIGLRPSDDPRADDLFNPNIADKNQASNGIEPKPTPEQTGSLTSPEETTNG